jgi:hypothetical protein
MSRITYVGSPVTVPITRASPAGTGLSQCTREEPPGVPLGFAVGLADEAEGVVPADALAVAVTAGWALGLGAVPLGEPPHAVTARAAASATRIRCTR